MARAPRAPRAAPLLLLPLLCALGPAQGQPGQALDIVHPVRVDAGGAFLSFELWPRALHRRAVTARPAPRAFYELRLRGRALRLNLTANAHLLAPGFLCETRRRGGLGGTLLQTRAPACHLLGRVQDPQREGGLAAISACDGLTGVFRMWEEDFFIQPLRGARARPGRARPHVVYRRQAPQRPAARGNSRTVGTCGVQASPELESWRERWQQRQPRPRRLHRRSVSKEKWVETLVVADAKMVDYHGQPDVESYVLTIMNMVAGLFHDPSVGSPVHITVVRLVLLEEEEEDLKITHHADSTLRSFCRWQKTINPKGDAHPLHHDTAILLTRKDLCATMNQPCETLGLSHLAGMCQPHRSCSINEDSGLPLAFTVAHELGHSFGIQHDGSGNDCEPEGKRPHIMSPQLLYDSAPLTWSRCSRQYMSRFLDRGWGQCLDDPPAKDVVNSPSVLPGVLYDVGHQCRLQYGAYSAFCDDVDDVCHTLWCSVGTTCHSKLDAAVDGTRCGDNKWCLSGECVPVGTWPAAVDGAWSGWSAWSACSRSCGVGVQSAERQCTQPAPRYEGRFCVGARRRVRLCNPQPCPPGQPSFRHVQCGRFNSRPHGGHLHTWLPVVNDASPCELHCRPSGERFAEKLRDAVVDGTPCYPGQARRDVCINGICKSVGCDLEIDSDAEEDRCGVCRGDGSTCHTVRAAFQEAEGLGYVDVGLIPAGARDISIREVAEAANFLALRGVGPDQYFLNGGWTIQWAGEYPAAGTTFTYARAGDLETLSAPGPTLEPLWVQLLFQESNPGVQYEYTVHRAPGLGGGQLPRFSWSLGPWSKCSVTCGTGTQRQSPHCEEQAGGRVDDTHCDPLQRPDERQRTCSQEPCPARWWAGEWQTCSRSCGPGGLVRRPVLCVRGVGPQEQSALPTPACQHLPQPSAEAPCGPLPPCPGSWAVGNWSQCSVTCGTGVQRRHVLCANDTAAPCEEAGRPPGEAACHLPACPWPSDVLGPEGSGSGAPDPELANEVDFVPRRTAPTPRPTMLDNAIDEGIPGPALVDDFYYDYNFITFHEDLSYLPFSEPEPRLVGAEEPAPPSPEAGGEGPSETSRGDGTPPVADPGAQTAPTARAEDRVLPVTVMTVSRGGPAPTAGLGGHTSPGGDKGSQASPTRAMEGWTPPATGTKDRAPPTASAGDRMDPTADTEEETSPTADPQEWTPPTADTEQWTPHTAGAGDWTGHTAEAGDGAPPTADTEEGTPSTTDTEQWTPPTASPPPGVLGERAPDPGPSPALPTFSRRAPLGNLFSEHKAPVEAPGPGAPQASRVPASEGLANEISQDEEFLGRTGGPIPPSPGLVAPWPSRSAVPSAPEPDMGEPWLGTAEAWSLGGRAPTPTANPAIWSRDSPEGPGSPPFPSQGPASKVLLPASARPGTWEPTLSPGIGIPEGGQSHTPGPNGHTTPGGSRAPETWPLSPVLAEEGSRDLQPPGSARWEVGAWSECSATCGLGAMWRPVRCSSGLEGDCVPAGRPQPARHCHLRPCATWLAGNWSKCSRGCGGGSSVRDVQCVDTRDLRPLRPFHCQLGPPQPPARRACGLQPCLSWYTSSWRECSEPCGGGQQQRLVTCPEPGLCEEVLRPHGTRPCNVQPCAHWTVGPWGQCSAPCGGGVQRRLVKCVSAQTGLPEEDSQQCSHEARPESVKPCATQDCGPPEHARCERDRLPLGFCETLRLLGHCPVPTIRAQCCRACAPARSLPPDSD